MLSRSLSRFIWRWTRPRPAPAVQRINDTIARRQAKHLAHSELDQVRIRITTAALAAEIARRTNRGEGVTQ